MTNCISLPFIMMNARICTGLLRLYAAGFVDTEEENTFSYFYYSVRKHFRHTPQLVATDIAAGIINIINKNVPQTKEITDDYHLNKNQQEHTWTHVCKIGRREEFDRKKRLLSSPSAKGVGNILHRD